MDALVDLPGSDAVTRTTGRRSARPAGVEIITRGERRRSWTVEQKRAIVAESLGPDLTPTEVVRNTLTLELRRFFNPSTAVSPSIKHDFTNHVTSVEVPVYFISGQDGATGGVKFNWRSDRHELTAVVFIGGTLGLLPN